MYDPVRKFMNSNEKLPKRKFKWEADGCISKLWQGQYLWPGVRWLRRVYITQWFEWKLTNCSSIIVSMIIVWFWQRKLFNRTRWTVNLKQDSINRIVHSLKLENVQHHLVVGNTIQKKSISRQFQYFQIEHDPNTKIKPGFNEFYQRFRVNGTRNLLNL